MAFLEETGSPFPALLQGKKRKFRWFPSSLTESDSLWRFPNPVAHPLSPCYELNSVPQNVYVKALTPKVTTFGDRAFKEVIKVK